MRRLRVGVIGCGLIAQVMHLPYLREMHDRFQIAALCDLSPETVALLGDAYDVPSRHTHWRNLPHEDLDAVLICTSGSHAQPAIAAARAGRHVFVEKPMCFSPREADAMIEAADAAGVTLMVGNMKRFDPAYERARPLIAGLTDLRLARITTLEAPFQPYVEHYPLVRGADVPGDILADLRAEGELLLTEALGADASPRIRRLYADVLLDTLVHEVNAMRGLLGEPEEVTSADAWMGTEGLTAVFRYPGDARCVMTWVNLPSLRNYSMELAFYSPAERVTLRYPSPFLRHEPTSLVVEGTDAGAHCETAITVSYQEAFKRELEHFHACVVEDRVPLTSGPEGRQDLVVLLAIARAVATGRPQPIAARA
ncbi:MAG TPA: Gfo/Idh/MocA family oxidoreductase [Chloroflexota bacterium]|nr:Gfo/Idh/MocA family oxidoreductase [Chloroflexota bacterium]